jgi:hypothetical protein
MTAQDTDLQAFSSNDLMTLRKEIDKLGSKQAAAKVR